MEEWHGRRREEEGRKRERGSHIGTVEKRPWEGHPETHPFLVAAQPNRLLRTATAATGIGGREGAQDNEPFECPGKVSNFWWHWRMNRGASGTLSRKRATHFETKFG
jgi:hypothetical protein